MAWRFILFVAAALTPVAAFAQQVPQSEWPATVLADIKKQASSCADAGGTPDYLGDFVWRADFNQDNVADYIVSALRCSGENGPMFDLYGYNAGDPLSVHLSGSRGHIVAWDGLVIQPDQIFGPPDIVSLGYRCESERMRPDSFCGADLVYANGKIIEKKRPIDAIGQAPEWKYDPTNNRASIAFKTRSRRFEQAWAACENGQPVVSLRYRSGLEPGARQIYAKIYNGDGTNRYQGLAFTREGTTNTWSAKPIDTAGLAMLTGKHSGIWIAEKIDADGNEQGLSLSLKGSTKAIKAVTAACGSNTTPVTSNTSTWAVVRDPLMAQIQLAQGSLAEVAVACIATTPVMLVQYRDTVPAGPPLQLSIKSGGKEHLVAMTRADESLNFVARPVAQDVLNLITNEGEFALSGDGVALGNVSLKGARLAVNEALAACMPVANNDEANIRNLVMRVYDIYAGDPSDAPALDMAAIYTPGLLTLEKRAAAAAPVEGIGADAFCECQDYLNARYTINAVTVRETTAEARVSFINFGETIIVTLRLTKTKPGWRIDDIISSQGRSYRADLKSI